MQISSSFSEILAEIIKCNSNFFVSNIHNARLYDWARDAWMPHRSDCFILQTKYIMWMESIYKKMKCKPEFLWIETAKSQQRFVLMKCRALTKWLFAGHVLERLISQVPLRTSTIHPESWRSPSWYCRSRF